MSNTKRKFKHSLVLILIAFIFTLEGTAMSFFERPPEEVVLASPIAGRITLYGKPASGAKVIRKVQQNEGREYIDETTADQNGRFELPTLKKEIVLKKLEQYVVRQNITVVYAGKSHDIWYMKSFSKRMYGELNGKPDTLACELSGQEQIFNMSHGVHGLLQTRCTWTAIIPSAEN